MAATSGIPVLRRHALGRRGCAGNGPPHSSVRGLGRGLRRNSLYRCYRCCKDIRSFKSGVGEIVRRLLLSIALLLGLSGVTFGQTTSASEIAPGGKLRVGMIAIAVLGGVAEPVARFIGQKLGAAVELVMY